MEPAPERKTCREQTIAIVAVSDRAKAEQLRKDLENAERDNTGLLKQSDELGSAAMRAAGDRDRAQIAAMTPQEVASPAFMSGNLELAPASAPNASAIVRVKSAFYRVRGTPVEPRAFLVRMPNAYAERKDQHVQLHQQLDWAAVKRLVNP